MDLFEKTPWVLVLAKLKTNRFLARDLNMRGDPEEQESVNWIERETDVFK